jgi:hypothetical protein
MKVEIQGIGAILLVVALCFDLAINIAKFFLG